MIHNGSINPPYQNVFAEILKSFSLCFLLQFNCLYNLVNYAITITQYTDKHACRLSRIEINNLKYY